MLQYFKVIPVVSVPRYMVAFCLVSKMQVMSQCQIWVRHHLCCSFQIPTLAASLFQLGRCRSVKEFEKLNRIGEGTYGIVCEWSRQSSVGTGRLTLCTPDQAEAGSQTLIPGGILEHKHQAANVSDPDEYCGGDN